MPIHELAALGAAACWALTGLLAARPVAEVGPFAFNFYRQCFVALVLGGLVLLSGAWRGTDPALLPALALSGFVGVFMGDTMLFFALGLFVMIQFVRRTSPSSPEEIRSRSF